MNALLTFLDRFENRVRSIIQPRPYLPIGSIRSVARDPIMTDLDHATFEGIAALVLEVPYPNNHVRMIVNDTLPWTADQALAFHKWSDEEVITFHINILERKIDECIGVAAGEAFRLRHPGTATPNIRLVLRLRHLPVPGAEAFLRLIEKRVNNEGMQFLYGYGGDAM